MTKISSPLDLAVPSSCWKANPKKKKKTHKTVVASVENIAKDAVNAAATLFVRSNSSTLRSLKKLDLDRQIAGFMHLDLLYGDRSFQDRFEYVNTHIRKRNDPRRDRFVWFQPNQAIQDQVDQQWMNERFHAVAPKGLQECPRVPSFHRLTNPFYVVEKECAYEDRLTRLQLEIRVDLQTLIIRERIWRLLSSTFYRLVSTAIAARDPNRKAPGLEQGDEIVYITEYGVEIEPVVLLG